MKKTILIVALTIFGINHIIAQKINFGAKAGVNFASISGEGADKLNGRTSFHAGLTAEILLVPKFSLQPEILYSAQGAAVKGYVYTAEGIISYEAKMQLAYINFPIMANYHITEKFSLQAGPQIGLLISAKAKADAFFEDETANESDNVKDEFKTFDLGIGFGAEYEFSNGIFFQARYVLGLTNILKPVDLITVDLHGNPTDPSFRGGKYQPKSHNNVFQVSVGYMF